MAKQFKKNHSQEFGSSDSLHKSKSFNLWRPQSLSNLVINKKKTKPVYESAQNSNNFKGSSLSLAAKDEKKKKFESLVKDISDGWNIVVTVVLVEIKGLLDPPMDGSTHEVYCKFRLGSETYKSKSVPSTKNPVWNERFKLHLHKDKNINIDVRDKGKLKSFMGSAILDLSTLEKERTHEVWTSLNDGYGFIHLSVTMCTVKHSPDVVPDDSPPNFVTSHHNPGKSLPPTPVDSSSGNNLGSELVAELHVKIIGAKGLPYKPCAYAILEVDNERVQTHTDRAGSQPTWNKTFQFKVYDVASTLEIKVYNKTINPLKEEALGRVTIPLLRINNGQTRWYALKDRTNRNIAKGNCPRVQVELNLVWNPIKAVMKFFQHKTEKYIKPAPKFNIALAYSNVEFTRDMFDLLQQTNEHYKHLFEWENTQLSFTALVAWILFWQIFQLWMLPLFMLMPFFYFGLYKKLDMRETIECLRGYNKIDELLNYNIEEKIAIKVVGTLQRIQDEKGISKKISSIQDTAHKVANAVDMTASVVERLYNLVTFKVPILSYVAMGLLLISSIAFYIIPLNKLLILFGICKFCRKLSNPQRVPNNDLLDFILRVPDCEILKDWKELPVPEPNQNVNTSS